LKWGNKMSCAGSPLPRVVFVEGDLAKNGNLVDDWHIQPPGQPRAEHRNKVGCITSARQDICRSNSYVATFHGAAYGVPTEVHAIGGCFAGQGSLNCYTTRTHDGL
jgi:hypothetical protein